MFGLGIPDRFSAAERQNLVTVPLFGHDCSKTQRIFGSAKPCHSCRFRPKSESEREYRFFGSCLNMHKKKVQISLPNRDWGWAGARAGLRGWVLWLELGLGLDAEQPEHVVAL